jgi:hypothetical protein
MNDDRSLERAARSWIEEGPTRAPDRTVDAALARIQSIPQERDLRIPWRFQTMNPVARLAAGAVVATVAIAGSFYLFARQPSGPGGVPTPGPTTVPTPTRAMAGPLAAGTYFGPALQVADIVAAVDADTTLTAADRTQVIDVLFAIRGKTTWQDSIEFRNGQMFERQTVDGVTAVGSFGRYSFPDDHTLVYTERINGSDVVTKFDLIVNGNSFTLHRTTPLSAAADEFVTRKIFESGPFTLR